MIKEMTNKNYFCISFDPSVVSVSIECFDEETGEKNFIENADINKKYNFPFIRSMPEEDLMWISMAREDSGSLKRLVSGHIKLSFTAKSRSFEDAGVKCGISYDCRTVQSAETLRQDRVEFNIADGNVSIEYYLSDPLPQTEKLPEDLGLFKEKVGVQTEPAVQTAEKVFLGKAAESGLEKGVSERGLEKGAAESGEDILRNIYADLKVLRFYTAYDSDGSVAKALRSAAETLENKGVVSIETVYEAEEKIAAFMASDTELLHRYKIDTD